MVCSYSSDLISFTCIPSSLAISIVHNVIIQSMSSLLQIRHRYTGELSLSLKYQLEHFLRQHSCKW